MAMRSDKPMYFPVGTPVSAKYRGAYCSAVVRKVTRIVKVKVQFDNKQDLGGRNRIRSLPEENIQGELVPGKKVEALYPELGVLRGTILQVNDHSVYTVVYDDGDTNNLRRSQICIPGGRHFRETESLDAFPLMNPEEFGNPVKIEYIQRCAQAAGTQDMEVVGPDASVVPVPVVDLTTEIQHAPRCSQTSTTSVQKTTGKLATKGTKRRGRRAKKATPPVVPTAIDLSIVKIEPEDEIARPAEVPSRPIQTCFFYYVMPPAGLNIIVQTAPSCRKRKAFIPKKVIKVANQMSSETNFTQTEPLPEQHEPITFGLDRNITTSSGLENRSLRQPETSSNGDANAPASTSRLSGGQEEEPIIEYTHKKLRLMGNFKRLSSSSPQEPAPVIAEVPVAAPTIENPSSVDGLYTELATIVKDKNVEVPDSPPVGKNFNFVPNMEGITNTTVRQKLITDSLKSLVIQYFSTKELLRREKKRLKKAKKAKKQEKKEKKLKG